MNKSPPKGKIIPKTKKNRFRLYRDLRQRILPRGNFYVLKPNRNTLVVKKCEHEAISKKPTAEVRSESDQNSITKPNKIFKTPKQNTGVTNSEKVIGENYDDDNPLGSTHRVLRKSSNDFVLNERVKNIWEKPESPMNQSPMLPKKDYRLT